MIKNTKISLIASMALLIAGVLSSPMQFANAQENQTEEQKASVSLQKSIDEIMKVHPILSELESEEPSTLVQKLYDMDAKEAVHTLLALEALEELKDLLAAHLLDEETN